MTFEAADRNSIEIDKLLFEHKDFDVNSITRNEIDEQDEKIILQKDQFYMKLCILAILKLFDCYLIKKK